jgi:hypothetical protein
MVNFTFRLIHPNTKLIETSLLCTSNSKSMFKKNFLLLRVSETILKPVAYSVTEFIMTGLSTSHAYTFTHFYVNSHTHTRTHTHTHTHTHTPHPHIHIHTHIHTNKQKNKQTNKQTNTHQTTLTGTGNVMNFRSRKMLVIGTAERSGLLGTFEIFRKATISFVMSVACLSKRNNSTPTGWIVMKFVIWLVFEDISR